MIATSAKLRGHMGHMDWALTYLDLAILQTLLGLDGAIVMGYDEN